MPKLENITVEWVSLVDRPAIRSARNPSEPQRFLLTKSEKPMKEKKKVTLADKLAKKVKLGKAMTRDEQMEYLRSESPQAAAAAETYRNEGHAVSPFTKNDTSSGTLEDSDAARADRAARAIAKAKPGRKFQAAIEAGRRR